MKSAKAAAVPRREGLGSDPLSAEDILQGFYRPPVGTVAERPIGPVPEVDPGAAAKLPPAGEPWQLPGGRRPLGREQADADAEAKAKKPKPSHYKIVCISLYVEDIERLDTLVAEMKRRGHTKANKSQLIRAALEQIDLDKVPKAH